MKKGWQTCGKIILALVLDIAAASAAQIGYNSVMTYAYHADRLNLVVLYRLGILIPLLAVSYLFACLTTSRETGKRWTVMFVNTYLLWLLSIDLMQLIYFSWWQVLLILAGLLFFVLRNKSRAPLYVLLGVMIFNFYFNAYSVFINIMNIIERPIEGISPVLRFLVLYFWLPLDGGALAAAGLMLSRGRAQDKVPSR